MAQAAPEDLIELLAVMITHAVQHHDVGCVVIDCPAIGTAYAAAAARLANIVLLVVEDSLLSLAGIQQFLPPDGCIYGDMGKRQVRVVINKARRSRSPQQPMEDADVLAVIPVMDFDRESAVFGTRGLWSPITRRLEDVLDVLIADMAARLFRLEHPALVPRGRHQEKEWLHLLQDPRRLECAPPIQKTRRARALIPIGLFLLGLGVSAMYLGEGVRPFRYGGMLIGVAGFVLCGCGGYSAMQYHGYDKSITNLKGRGSR
jgi:hypothetical protein